MCGRGGGGQLLKIGKRPTAVGLYFYEALEG